MLWELAVTFLLGYVGVTVFKYLKEYMTCRKLAATLPSLNGSLPVIGHLVTMLKSPEDFFIEMRRWSAENFPIWTVHTLGFVGILINGPDIMEKVLSTTKHHKKSLVYNLLHRWLGEGLLTSEGQKWQTRRKTLTPAFHFNILKQFILIFNDKTTVLVNYLNDVASKNPVVDVLPIISELTLLTINETSMGVTLNFNTEEGSRYKQDIYDISDKVFQRFIRPWQIFDWYYYYFTSYGRYYRKITSSLHRFTEKVIKEREKGFKQFDVPVDENDDYSFSRRKNMAFLDLLINAKLKNGIIDDQGIREEVNTFMFEGHDTTSMNISYTLMLMANNPIEQERVYQELIQVLGNDLNKQPTYHELQELQYTERCIKESLRLYPSVPFIGRTSEEDIETDYGIVPKGMPLFLMIYDLHRHPKVWPNPEKFDPDRFTVENSAGRHPYAYIPFSAGPRNCIGQRFAMLEAKSVLAGILRKFRLEVVDTPQSLVLIQDIILRPKNGIKVKFTLRN